MMMLIMMMMMMIFLDKRRCDVTYKKEMRYKDKEEKKNKDNSLGFAPSAGRERMRGTNKIWGRENPNEEGKTRGRENRSEEGKTRGRQN
jgi:hypothetical protein